MNTEDSISLKACSTCKMEKPIECFSKKISNKDGKNTQCKECKNEYNKSYRHAHPEQADIYRQKYKSSLEAKEKRAEYGARYYRENKEHRPKPNADLVRIYNQSRKARKNGDGGKLSKGIVKKLFALQLGKCPSCGCRLDKKSHLDHIVPLARGGRNEDSNMQLLHAICNLKKAAKHPVDFMQERGFLL